MSQFSAEVDRHKALSWGQFSLFYLSMTLTHCQQGRHVTHFKLFVEDLILYRSFDNLTPLSIQLGLTIIQKMVQLRTGRYKLNTQKHHLSPSHDFFYITFDGKFIPLVDTLMDLGLVTASSQTVNSDIHEI